MSRIWSSRYRNKSCSPVSRRSRGRVQNVRSCMSSSRESQLPIRRNPTLKFAGKVSSPSPIPANSFDQILNSLVSLDASWFFTDDKQKARDQPPRCGWRMYSRPSCRKFYFAIFVGCEPDVDDIVGAHSEPAPKLHSIFRLYRKLLRLYRRLIRGRRRSQLHRQLCVKGRHSHDRKWLAAQLQRIHPVMRLANLRDP